MPKPIIIGIHGLLNKPPYQTLQSWWGKAIAEGLRRNYDIPVMPPFELAYWADIRHDNPISVADLNEKYEKVDGHGPFARYGIRALDKPRAIAQKWGGRMLDKEKELIGLGTKVEDLLGRKFDDLADYYDSADIRQQMRARLKALLARHHDKRIMLLAHSMGSIIAYDVLRSYDDSGTIKIDHFVTLGSPLGLPIVGHKIWDEFGTKQTPHVVRRWTNIADPGDKVALDCNLADEYAPYNGVQVEDVLVYNRYANHEGVANNHKSYGYLRTPELSNYIRKFM